MACRRLRRVAAAGAQHCSCTLTTMGWFAGLFILTFSLALSLGSMFFYPFIYSYCPLMPWHPVFVPLTGVLIRFRANYNPKGLQLDAEGGAQAHTG